MRDRPISVLFVCLGNICRSPTAHGVCREAIARRGLAGRIVVDSAGTGDWHLGSAPDRRASEAARQRGVEIDDLRARQVTAADIERFDHVLAMDRANLDDLLEIAKQARPPRAEIALLGDYGLRFEHQEVPDPYMGGPKGFEGVLDRVEDGVEGLLDVLVAELDRD